MYAILDIETTGGKYGEEGIIEIAIYRFDGHDITDRFSSLVNPGRGIQNYVMKLTGISNTMVRSAPKFHELAKRIVEITADCTLVAHNAEFDYRMLRTEFKRLGFDYRKRTICTVQLSKKLIPRKKSYKLGRLCLVLGIPLTNRHRADGDARATVELFKLLLAKDTSKEVIKNAIQEETGLKMNLLTILENLPAATGVYYVHKSGSDIIYIGKSINIKGKINRHFTGSSKIAKAIQNEVSTVTYETTGNELIASLKAHHEIMENKPIYNSYTYRNPPKELDQEYHYPTKNMIIVDKGRETQERSAVLIEDGLYKGYGFFNLNHQIKNSRILHSIITPMEHDPVTDRIIKSYLLRNKVKIVPI